MRTLYWLSHDLRFDDNPALHLATQSAELMFVYVIDPKWFSNNRYGLKSMGRHRWRFIQQSLLELDRSLRANGHQLTVCAGDPVATISELVALYQLQRVVCSHQMGLYERKQIAQLERLLPDVRLEVIETHTLFNLASLPFDLCDLPSSYSRFRRTVENSTPRELSAEPEKWPTPIRLKQRSEPFEKWALHCNKDDPFPGGEKSAQAHVDWYFAGDLPLDYKQVRNSLDGWENSSKMSPWLNSGCLSSRRLLDRIHRYEKVHGQNESTHWLYVELLWREYFQWLALKVGRSLFSLNGIEGQPCSNGHDPRKFSDWCEGRTKYPLVNACMRQLNDSGYLSNRGRQIVASCLVNELKEDWRYGAAWFEQQLLDYDVAVNWSNWQYIAGVGVDPRGGRHFNLAKQAELYDADGRYRERWLSDAGNTDSLTM